MKKIKLVISDFHIGAGPRLEDGTPNILEDFHNENKFIEFLEYYSTNTFSKFNVELIINGDFFNFFQLMYDNKFHAIITESLSIFQMKSIIKGWPNLFSALRSFNRYDNKTITFITGNHDAQLLWDGVKQILRDEIGGVIKFYDLYYEFDGFHVEHGQQLDQQNMFNPKKFFIYKNTPEPILNIPWTSRFCIEVLSPIKKKNPISDKIKPFRSFMTWVFFHDPRFFIYSFVKTLSYMIKSLIFPSKYFDIPVFEFLRMITKITLYPKLITEAKQLLNNDKIHTVILGHTHGYKYIQYANDKEYVNTGTWTETTSLNLTNLGTRVFLSYAIIQYSREFPRPRAKLKRWFGSWKIMDNVY